MERQHRSEHTWQSGKKKNKRFERTMYWYTRQYSTKEAAVMFSIRSTVLSNNCALRAFCRRRRHYNGLSLRHNHCQTLEDSLYKTLT